MRTHVLLTTATIDQALRELPLPWTVDARQAAGTMLSRPEFQRQVGAWLDFYGIVRDLELVTTPESGAREQRIVAIEYEAHPEMAQHQLEQLVERIGAKHAVEALLVIHRIGRVPVAEPSLLVRILSGHRGESLRACAELIDELKKWVPIWKHPIST